MKKFLAGGFALAALLAAPALASTFAAMDQKALVRAADVVIEGEVLQVSSFWTPGGEVIISEALILVRENVVGGADGVIVVRTFGGTVNGYTVEAHGFPTFEKGERQLLFLEAEEDGVRRVAGYQQGQFRIVPDLEGRPVAVSALEADTHLVKPNGRVVTLPRELPLEQLKGLVRNEARRQGRALEN